MRSTIDFCTALEKEASRQRFNDPVLLILVMTVFTASCGDGADTGTGTKEGANEPSMSSTSGIQQIGRVNARQFFGESEDGSDFVETSISANFRQYDRELTNDELTEISGQFDISNGPVCRRDIEIVDRSDPGVPYGWEPSSIPEYRLISAGEVLPITTPVGSWQELGPSQYDFIQYDSSVNAPLPVGAILNIPGDEFPEVESIAIPTVERVNNVSVTGTESGRFMPDSLITWQPSKNIDNIMSFRFYISYSFTVYDASIKSDVLLDKSVSVRCAAPDTEEFAFPADIQETLSLETLLSEDISISRAEPRITRQIGDALLWISSYTPLPRR